MFILTMIIALTTGPVVITAEYQSKETCEAAKDLNRASLSAGRVELATCTKK